MALVKLFLWEMVQDNPNTPAVNIEDKDSVQIRQTRIVEFLERVASHKKEISQAPLVLSLAFSMLSEESSSRPTAAVVLRHEFFSPTQGDPTDRVNTSSLTQQAGTLTPRASIQGDVKNMTPNQGDVKNMTPDRVNAGSPAQRTGSPTLGAPSNFKLLPVEELPTKVFDAVVKLRELNPHLEPGDLNAYFDAVSKLGRHHNNFLLHYILACGKYPSFVSMFAPKLAKLQKNILRP